MLLALQRYPAEIQYVPGKKQHTADMLSRAPTEASKLHAEVEQVFQVQSFLGDLNISDPIQDSHFTSHTYEKIKNESKGDEEISAVKQLINKGWTEQYESIHDTMKKYYSLRDQLTILDGIVYKGPQLVIQKT